MLQSNRGLFCRLSLVAQFTERISLEDEEGGGRNNLGKRRKEKNGSVKKGKTRGRET